MITYSLLMTVGIIAFVVGVIIVFWNMFRTKRAFVEAASQGIGLHPLNAGRKMFTHFIGGFIAWVGAVLTVAGFIWFLVALVSHR